MRAVAGTEGRRQLPVRAVSGGICQNINSSNYKTSFIAPSNPPPQKAGFILGGGYYNHNLANGATKTMRRNKQGNDVSTALIADVLVQCALCFQHFGPSASQKDRDPMCKSSQERKVFLTPSLVQAPKKMGNNQEVVLGSVKSGFRSF